MKHLKTYENNKKIYKKNDIVLLKKNIDAFKYPYARILKRFPGKSKDRFLDKYHVEILYPNTNYWSYSDFDDIHETAILQYDIIRKLSKEDIENLDVEIKSKEYNL